MSCDQDLQSWGWTDLSSYSPVVSHSEKEQQIESSLHGGIMSRCLRHHDGLLDRSLPRSSASFSVGGTSWRSTRSLKLSSSCSESLLLNTSRKLSAQSLLNSSVHSKASDASLLSSLLDDSSVQESLDPDIDPKESNFLADRTLIGSDSCCPTVQTLSRTAYCKDCDLDSDRKESTCCPSSSGSKERGLREPRDPETFSIFCRDRNRKTRLGKQTGDVCRWLSRRWRHMITRDLLTRRFPLRLLLLLLPLLLLLGPCWFTPAALRVVFPATTDWRTAVSNVPGLSSVYSLMSPGSQSAEGAVEEWSEEELIYSGPPTGEEEAAADESARLFRLEESLTTLWERVEAGGRQTEQRHKELLQLYAELQQQSGRDESWLRGLLELELTTRLNEDQWQREVQWRREANSPSSPALSTAVSFRVECHTHDALLAEVARLEAAVEDIRRDVKGLSACQEGCRRLDAIQQSVSEQVSFQVREEVRTLVYGNQLTVGGRPPGDVLPESLLLWLSQQYVSGADLQVSLVSLELSILQNISQQLEQHRSQEEVRAAQHTARAAGASMTQEDFHVILKNALRLFSQDRTGLADYALESGGGSVLSTRCSETYETKAALLSLFGYPLWYFSQSPRAVIQPDVHPGNCWAFRGSKGFLVIRLSMRIVPTAFSLEHIPKALAPSGMLLSAPKHFSVYGLADEDEEQGKLLGSYSYEEDGESLQTFAVTEDCNQTFQIIEVQVLSNWGHPDYTCIYRLRVHGTPGDA